MEGRLEKRLEEGQDPRYAVPFEFTGNAGEYFRIWIVNVALTILTLGVYSAWAKVRKKRYFYGNTLLLDAPFEYLADPVKILKGRLIVLGVFLVYVTSLSISPAGAILVPLLYIPVFPWLVVRSLAFKARNTAYRNLRFDFRATYAEAFRVFIGLSFFIPLTLGLYYPMYDYRRREFVISHNRYGTAPFVFTGRSGGFYGAYLVALGFLLLGGLTAFVVIMPLIWSLPEASSVLVFMPLIISLLIYLLPVIYIRTAITNLVWSNTSTAQFRLNSTLRFSRMLTLYLSNALAIVASLGLLIPWASIRMARYRLDNLKLLPTGDLDGFIASEQERVSAAGEEIAEFFDFDIGL